MRAPVAEKLGQAHPKAEILTKLELFHINVQAVMQLRSQRRNQDRKKDSGVTPHFLSSLALRPDVSNVRSLIDLSGLQIKVQPHHAPKGPLQCKSCQRIGHNWR
jgi:hypothetical protein